MGAGLLNIRHFLRLPRFVDYRLLTHARHYASIVVTVVPIVIQSGETVVLAALFDVAKLIECLSAEISG
jgi:hypothetical protein